MAGERTAVNWLDTTAARRVWLLVTAAICLAMLLTVWWTGPLPQMLFGHDMMFLLDGGWKWHWGYRPHVDYYSPFGAVSYLLVGAGIGLSGGLPNAMPAAVCVFALTFLPVCLYVAFSRFNVIAAAAATVVLLAMVLAPHVMKFGSGGWSYATVYNRWAYLLFCILLMTVTFRPREWRWADALDGLIAATCVCLAMMLKISYGLLAVMLFALAMVLRPRTLRFWAAALAGAVVWFVVFGLLLRWTYAQMLGDIGIASQSRAGLGPAGLVQWGLFLYPELGLVVVLALIAFAFGWITRTDGVLPELRQLALVLFGFAACAAAIEMSNSPLGTTRENPVLSLGAIVLAGTIARRSPNHGTNISRRMVAISGWVALLLCTVFPLVVRWWSEHSGAAATGLLRVVADSSRFAPRDLRILAAAGAAWFIVAHVIVWRPATARVLAVAFAVVTAALVVLPVFSRNISGLYLAAKFKSEGSRLSPAETFQTGPLRGQQISAFGGDPPLPTTYVEKIQDGVDLLSRTGNSHRSVVGFDFSNAFDVTRGVKANRTGPTCWQLGFVYSPTAAPAAERVINLEDAVMFPKIFGDGNQHNLAVLMAHYGSFLEQHFEPAGESIHWRLFVPKRTQAPQPTP